MKFPVFYFAFSYIKNSTKPDETCKTYADDMLNAGVEDNVQLPNTIRNRCQCQNPDRGSTCLAGLESMTIESEKSFHQKNIKSNPISKETSFTTCRSLLVKFAWTQQTRPDITHDAVALQQVYKKHYSEKPEHYVKKMRTILHSLQNSIDVAILFSELDEKSMRIKAYSGA